MRIINLNTEVVISEEDWTLNFGLEGRDAIEADVRSWPGHCLPKDSAPTASKATPADQP